MVLFTLYTGSSNAVTQRWVSTESLLFNQMPPPLPRVYSHVTKCLQSNYRLPRARQNRERDIYLEREDDLNGVPSAWARHRVPAGAKQNVLSANKYYRPGRQEELGKNCLVLKTVEDPRGKARVRSDNQRWFSRT